MVKNMIKDDLEKKLSELLPLKHYVLTGYARNGFYLLLKALEWDNSAEIIIPAFTCSIIPRTIAEAGYAAVPVDVEENGINIDPDKIRKSITQYTKAIYVVHTYGTAAKIDEICSIAKKYKLIVIEDIAQALFLKYNEKYLGTYGDYAVLSFTKKIINYEGGAIGTNNTAIYKKISSLQKNYKQKYSLSLTELRERGVRAIGSMWEKTFSFPILLIFKLLDVINDIAYKGNYGLSIDPRKFFMTDYAKRITMRQLETIHKNKMDYMNFKELYQKKITITELNHNAQKTTPAYYTGVVDEKNKIFNLTSFRSWHNFNSPGKYPRADYLYSNYRIFSKIIMLQNWKTKIKTKCGFNQSCIQD